MFTNFAFSETGAPPIQVGIPIAARSIFPVAACGVFLCALGSAVVSGRVEVFFSRFVLQLVQDGAPYSEMAMATSYNWLFLWDYTVYKWV